MNFDAVNYPVNPKPCSCTFCFRANPASVSFLGLNSISKGSSAISGVPDNPNILIDRLTCRCILTPHFPKVRVARSAVVYPMLILIVDNVTSKEAKMATKKKS